MSIMRPPCEIVVKKVLPAIRSILVKDLTKRHELSQMEIAKKLGITQPAVSQYLRSPRGDNDLMEKLKEKNLYSQLQELSDEIAEGNSEKTEIIRKYCDFCNEMGEKEVLCTIHAKSAPYLTEEECKVCLKAKKDQSK